MATKMLFNRRTILWTVAFLVFGLSMKILLPGQVQEKLCEVYKVYWSETVRKALRFAMNEHVPGNNSPESQPASSENRAAMVSLGSGITPELIEQQIQDYICTPSPQEPVFSAIGILGLCPAVLPVAYLLAVLDCFFLPAKPKISKQTPFVLPIHAVSTARPMHSLTKSERERIENYPGLALRAAQMRRAIVYAFLSGLSTTFLRPDFFQSSSFFEGNGGHILGLASCAFGASVWTTHTPAIRYRDLRNSTLAIQIGFGGVFFGSLIALSIALPYQMLTPIPNAAINEHQALIILVIRLLVLPVFGLFGASSCVLVARKLGAQHMAPLVEQ